MPDFNISQLADPAGCFGAWPSTARRVARNSVGTFYAVETRVGNIAAGAPNDFAIIREVDGALSILWAAANLPTNMITIDSFSTGELYAAWSDYTNSINYVAYWADSSASAMPVISAMTGNGCAGNGKIAFMANEADRSLYLFGNSGWLFRFSDTGVERGRQHVYQPVTDQPNYITLQADENGLLYIGLCDAMFVGGQIDYDAIVFVMTPNAGDVGSAGGAVFFAGPWPGAALALPFDPGANGPCAWVTLGVQTRTGNNLLIGSAVHGGILHVACAQASGQAAHFFATDDLHAVSVEMASLNFGAQPMIPSGAIHRPLCDGLAFPRACSGGVTVRTDGTYVVLHDRTSLIAMASRDQGRTWQTIARTAVPGLGSDMIHYVSLLPGRLFDADLVGMFVVEHCTPAQWAAGTAPLPPAYAANNPSATLYRFSLQIS